MGEWVCKHCGKPVYYDAGLQSWRHERSRYDACRPFSSDRIYASPIPAPNLKEQNQ